MQATDPIKLVIFDLGGVMVRLATSWEDACRRAGVAYPEVVMQPDVAAKIRAIIDPSERGHLTQAQFDERVGELVGLSPDELAKVSAGWLAEPYPGIDELVDRLHARDVALACLSNTNERHWDIMRSEGRHASLPVGRFAHHFVSHEIGARKPEPAIYEHVEKATGIAPGSILFYDDRADNTAAAAERGWRTLTINPARPVEQMAAHLTSLGLLDEH